MKMVIVGAGIAGLCAGVYARKSGFDVEIVEKEQRPGGLATNWTRGDYTFETCLHWLLGSNPASPYHSLWKEVFDIDQLKFIDAEEFARVETESGQSLVIWRDVDRMEREFMRVAPEDGLEIQRLVRGVRRLKNCELPLANESKLSHVKQTLKMLPYLPEMGRWSKLTTADLGWRFKNPLLRQFFGGAESLGQMSAIALVFSLAWMAKKDAGYPLGGSQAVIRAIERNFKELGGQVRYGSTVNRIMVEDDRAVGVELGDGCQIRADWVVSAADGHTTLFDWIPEQYVDKKAKAPYRDFPTFPSYLQISLGVNRDLRDQPGFLNLLLDSRILIDPQTAPRQLSFRVFHFDPTFAPAGKTPVTCFIPTQNTAYWEELHRSDPTGYAAKKKGVANAVIRVLERRIPGIQDSIEVVDVSTPVSVTRHTGNWKGSMEGFLLTPKVGFRPLRMKLPQLGRFMMIGQWVMPGGGLPSGLMTGRRCIQEICLEAGMRFDPERPTKVA